jgi:hypothetical protein
VRIVVRASIAATVAATVTDEQVTDVAFRNSRQDGPSFIASIKREPTGIVPEQADGEG